MDAVSDPQSINVANRALLGSSPLWLQNDWVVYTGCNYWKNPERAVSMPCRAGATWIQAEVTDYRVILHRTPPARPSYSHRRDGNWDVYSVTSTEVAWSSLAEPRKRRVGDLLADGSKIAFVSDRDAGKWSSG